MTVLNILTSRLSGGNSGIPSQRLEPGKIVGAVLCDPSFKITAANMASLSNFKSVLGDACLVIGSGRIYPISNFDDPSDNSEAPKKNKTAFGRTTFGDEGGYDWEFRLDEFGYETAKNLRKFNDRNMSFYFVDKTSKLFGQYNSDGDLLPYEGKFRCYPWKMDDGTNPVQFKVNFVMDNVEQMCDNLGFVQCDWNFFNDIKGNIDVDIQEVSHTATTAVVKVTVANRSIDLGANSDFETSLKKPANWRLRPVAGGSDVVPSTIVYTPPTGTDTVGYFTITHASLTASHYLSLDTPAVLAADGMGGTPDNGYESNTITVAYTA